MFENLVAVARLPHQKISYIQEELTEKCTAILLGYRRNCAAATAPSQASRLYNFVVFISSQIYLLVVALISSSFQRLSEPCLYIRSQ